MDFASSLVTLRDNIVSGLEPAFHTEIGVDICGRPAALHTWFDSNAETKLFGIMATGNSTHSHEHRLLFAVPTLDEDGLAQWWDYILKVQEELVCPDAGHQFTILSLILFCESASPRALRRLRRLANEVVYRKPQFGWSSVRVAVIENETGKISTSRMGAPLAAILRPALP